MSLAWTSDSAFGDGASCGPSLITAVQEQLGLSVTAQKGPVEVLVADHANRTPTEN